MKKTQREKDLMRSTKHRRDIVDPGWEVSTYVTEDKTRRCMGCPSLAESWLVGNMKTRAQPLEQFSLYNEVRGTSVSFPLKIGMFKIPHLKNKIMFSFGYGGKRADNNILFYFNIKYFNNILFSFETSDCEFIVTPKCPCK